MLYKYGSQDERVRWFQQLLTDLKLYNGAVDGVFGILTLEAVRAFQKQRKIVVDGIVGPVTMNEFIEVENELTVAPQFTTRGTVMGGSVNVRKGPGVSYKVLGTVHRNDILNVLTFDDYWYKIIYKEGEAYISSKYVKLIEVPIKLTEKTQAFLRSINSYIGKSIYVWGAQGQSTDTVVTEAWINEKEKNSITKKEAIDLLRKLVGKGINPVYAFDCSGLVIYTLMKLKYIKSDYTAHGIYTVLCASINKDRLQPGDLVFKKNTSGHVYHVGIYLGDNQVAHSKGRRYGVVEEKMATSWNAFGRINSLKGV